MIENVDAKAINFVLVMSEVNLMDNPKKWWIDIGATYHIYFDKIIFLTYNNC